jgi:hypothetical protein
VAGDLAAAAAAHRLWWEAASSGGGWHERVKGCDVYGAARSGTIAFPAGDADLAAAVAVCRERGLREVGCWALAEDVALGRRLNRIGFQDGWRPHWMAAEPVPGGGGDDVERLGADDRPLPGVPYWSGGALPVPGESWSGGSIAGCARAARSRVMSQSSWPARWQGCSTWALRDRIGGRESAGG